MGQTCGLFTLIMVPDTATHSKPEVADDGKIIGADDVPIGAAPAPSNRKRRAVVCCVLTCTIVLICILFFNTSWRRGNRTGGNYVDSLMLADFHASGMVWETVNDPVMGGKSESTVNTIAGSPDTTNSEGGIGIFAGYVRISRHLGSLVSATCRPPLDRIFRMRPALVQPLVVVLPYGSDNMTRTALAWCVTDFYFKLRQEVAEAIIRLQSLCHPHLPQLTTVAGPGRISMFHGKTLL